MSFIPLTIAATAALQQSSSSQEQENHNGNNYNITFDTSLAHTLFDADLTLQQLRELESYIDDYAFFNGFRWIVGRTRTVLIPAAELDLHYDNICSNYTERDCITKTENSSQYEGV